MTVAELRDSPDVPPGVADEVVALWHDARGDWERAHQTVQDLDTPAAAWVHAYLHRKEGDQWNANYWYQRAGRKMPRTSLAQEWDALVEEFLSAS